MVAIDLNGTIKTFYTVPKTWDNVIGLNYLSENELQQYGFYNVVEPEITKSQELGNLYFDDVNDVFTYEINNKTFSETIAELKESKISELKNTYNRVLQATDWYIIREAEGGTATPQEILDARTTYRNECATKESEIQALTTKANVINYELPEF